MGALPPLGVNDFMQLGRSLFPKDFPADYITLLPGHDLITPNTRIAGNGRK